jgi:hypothetical protein
MEKIKKEEYDVVETFIIPEDQGCIATFLGMCKLGHRIVLIDRKNTKAKVYYKKI